MQLKLLPGTQKGYPFRAQIVSTQHYDELGTGTFYAFELTPRFMNRGVISRLPSSELFYPQLIDELPELTVKFHRDYKSPLSKIGGPYYQHLDDCVKAIWKAYPQALIYEFTCKRELLVWLCQRYTE